jgi:hypothetical protein
LTQQAKIFYYEWIFISRERFFHDPFAIALICNRRFFLMLLREFLLIFASTLSVVSLSSCAFFPDSIKDLTPQQSAFVQATCTKVMRLQEGEAQWAGCVSSLSDSLVGEIQVDRDAYAYRDCTQTGLKRETREFSQCVLDRENVQLASNMHQGGALSQLDAAYVKPADGNSKGYYEASFDLRHRREQYSCAELDLEAYSGPYDQCVANLESSLFSIEHPPS